MGELKPGHVFKSRYRIERKIGHGGMGVVFEAVDLTRGELPCALKMIRAHREVDERYRRRFDAEFQLLTRLKHPHIVEVFEAAEAHDDDDQEERLYIAMELLRGESLGDWLKSGEQMKLSRGIRFINQALTALEWAHQAGVIHRDLKPDNLFIGRNSHEEEYLKILDFGVAKDLLSDISLTGSLDNAMIGTPHYMAPEQVRNEKVSPASDLYAIGVIIYQLIRGYPVFAHERFELPSEVKILPRNFQLTWLQIHAPAPSLDFDPILDQVVAQLLSKETHHRIYDARSLRSALQEWSLSHPQLAETLIPVRRELQVTTLSSLSLNQEVSPTLTIHAPSEVGSSAHKIQNFNDFDDLFATAPPSVLPHSNLLHAQDLNKILHAPQDSTEPVLTPPCGLESTLSLARGPTDAPSAGGADVEPLSSLNSALRRSLDPASRLSSGDALTPDVILSPTPDTMLDVTLELTPDSSSVNSGTSQDVSSLRLSAIEELSVLDHQDLSIVESGLEEVHTHDRSTTSKTQEATQQSTSPSRVHSSTLTQPVQVLSAHQRHLVSTSLPKTHAVSERARVSQKRSLTWGIGLIGLALIAVVLEPQLILLPERAQPVEHEKATSSDMSAPEAPQALTRSEMSELLLKRIAQTAKRYLHQPSTSRSMTPSLADTPPSDLAHEQRLRQWVAEPKNTSRKDPSPLIIKKDLRRAFFLTWLPHDDDARQALHVLNRVKITHLNTVENLHLYGLTLHRIHISKNQARRDRLAHKVFKKADHFLFQQLELGGVLSTKQRAYLDVRLAFYLNAGRDAYVRSILSRLTTHQRLDTDYTELLTRLK